MRCIAARHHDTPTVLAVELVQWYWRDDLAKHVHPAVLRDLANRDGGQAKGRARLWKGGQRILGPGPQTKRSLPVDLGGNVDEKAIKEVLVDLV
jgi:hypothetical protein